MTAKIKDERTPKEPPTSEETVTIDPPDYVPLVSIVKLYGYPVPRLDNFSAQLNYLAQLVRDEEEVDLFLGGPRRHRTPILYIVPSLIELWDGASGNDQSMISRFYGPSSGTYYNKDNIIRDICKEIGIAVGSSEIEWKLVVAER